MKQGVTFMDTFLIAIVTFSAGYLIISRFLSDPEDNSSQLKVIENIEEINKGQNLSISDIELVASKQTVRIDNVFHKIEANELEIRNLKSKIAELEDSNFNLNSDVYNLVEKSKLKPIPQKIEFQYPKTPLSVQIIRPQNTFTKTVSETEVQKTKTGYRAKRISKSQQEKAAKAQVTNKKGNKK